MEQKMSIEEALKMLEYMRMLHYDVTEDEYKAISVVLEEYNSVVVERDEWIRIAEMQNKRKYRSMFLKEFQAETNENTFPDYDEIYKRYYEQKELIKQLRGE